MKLIILENFRLFLETGSAVIFAAFYLETDGLVKLETNDIPDIFQLTDNSQCFLLQC